MNGFKNLSSITAGTSAMLSSKVFKKIAPYVLFINKMFYLIFIDLQNVGVISAAPWIKQSSTLNFSRF